jgi:uncharacterized protein (DUF58 family)
LVLFFFSLATEPITIDQVEIRRQLSRDRVEKKGDLIVVKVMIRNLGERIPVFEIVDMVPDVCTVHDGSNHWLLELKKNEEITLSYAIRCHKRGRYLLGPILTRGSDIFHFHNTIKEHAVFNSIAVVPQLIKVKGLPISRHRLLPITGNIPSLTYKGRDFDFQGIREYQPGDEVRAINWRVTAKFAQLATNEFALDQTARLFVVFDHTASTERVLEEGVMATLSTSEFLISQRAKVGFLGIGEFVQEIPPAPGKRQLLRINEFLIDTQASRPTSSEVLKLRIQKRLLPALPPFAQLFFISPLYSRLILDLLRELTEHRHNIALIIPRLEDEREHRVASFKASHIANSLLLLERAYVSKQIAKMGIVPLYWYPQGPQYDIIKVRRTR